MRVGMFMQPLHHGDLDYHEMYQRDVEACVHADKVGYDEVWVGEHYSQRTEPITNALQFLAYIAPLTRTIKLGTGVINLPNRHPAVVAGDVAMLDHLTKGRLMMGIGPGGLASDMELFKSLASPDRGRMMLESFEAIQKIWNSDPPYEIKGENWDFTVRDTVDASLLQGFMPRPYQKPHPLIATSSMSPYSGTAKLSGARGWGLISANFNPRNIVKTHWAAYAEGAKNAGQTADRAKWRVVRSVLITDTDKQAEDYLRRPDNTLRIYYRQMIDTLRANNYMLILKDRQDMKDEDVTPEYCLKEMVIAGSAETVTKKILDLSEEIGVFGTLLTTYHQWDDDSLWKKSMETTVKRVIPAVAAKLKTAR